MKFAPLALLVGLASAGLKIDPSQPCRKTSTTPVVENVREPL